MRTSLPTRKNDLCWEIDFRSELTNNQIRRFRSRHLEISLCIGAQEARARLGLARHCEPLPPSTVLLSQQRRRAAQTRISYRFPVVGPGVLSGPTTLELPAADHPFDAADHVPAGVHRQLVTRNSQRAALVLRQALDDDDRRLGQAELSRRQQESGVPGNDYPIGQRGLG